MGRKYILSGRVSFPIFHPPLSVLLISVPGSRNTSMASIWGLMVSFYNRHG
jgi:hypothetical protein